MIIPEELNWDTSFLGYKTGRIDIVSMLEGDLHETLIRAKEDDFKLVYIIDSQQQKTTSELLSKYDCFLSCTKVVYSKELIPVVDLERCKKIQSGFDVEIIYSIAYESGRYSRFKMDPHFEKNVFKRLYRKWVDNSLSGKIADDMFGYFDHDSISGFVSVKYYKEKSEIGLIGVSEKQRRKKIGKSLIQKVEIDSLKNGCSYLEVATQLENKQACQFYEKMGMKIKEKAIIYHVWL